MNNQGTSNNYNQPSGNQQHTENNAPRRTGGLLSSYGRHQSQELVSTQQGQPESIQQGNPAPLSQSQPARLNTALTDAPVETPAPILGGAPRSRSGLLSQHRTATQGLQGQVEQPGRALIPTQQGSLLQPLTPDRPGTLGLLSGAKHLMQGWSDRVAAISGKLAAIAGHTVQPPAPPLERYQSPMPAPMPVAPKTRRSTPWRRSRTIRVTMQMRNRRERWSRSKNFLPNALIALVACIILSSFSSTGYVYGYYQSQVPRLQELAKQTISQTSRIFDRNGKLLFEAYDENEGRRTPVAFDDIPKVLRDALVATEDSTFWTNSGVDPQGIARAAFGFLQSASIQGGGSTITQQVVKNMTGEDDPSITRKIPEAALAVALTQQYPKAKIMEMYFNVAPFGPLNLGIESAVQEYFRLERECDANFKCKPGVARLNFNPETGKDDPLLGLARATLLAGLPQSPSNYYLAGEEWQRLNALERQKLVLGRMVDLKMHVDDLGVITPEIAAQASEISSKMEFTPYERHKRAPHFVDWVMNQVQLVLGNGDSAQGAVAFNTGGFNIRTTISVEFQDYVEATVTRHLTQPATGPYSDGLALKDAHNVNTGAVVVLNAKTGEILAMNGSLDYYDDDIRVGGQYNAADPLGSLDGSPPGRPPGSTFKPFVYASTFEMGWYPGMALPDYRTYFPLPGQTAGAEVPTKEEENAVDNHMYAPPDYSKEGKWEFNNNREATVREALQESQNVGAVKAMKYAGPENVLNMAHRLGLHQVRGDGIAWALGTENATVLQMTSAYQTFANGGKRNTPQGILGIWDNYGHHLYHFDAGQSQSYQVMSPQVAFLTTSILTDEKSRYNEFRQDHVLSFADINPECAYVRQCSHPVASKTGTTDQLRDTWTIGYTPNIVVGAWTGNANGESMENVLGISGAAPIWHSVIAAASGYCGSSGDGIACPQDPQEYPRLLGVGTDLTFNPPPGVSQQCTSYNTGLMPAPGQRQECDWIIENQIPQQPGFVVR